MGLDMYLYKDHYVQRWDHISPPDQFSVQVTRGNAPYERIKPERVSHVIEQVAYWRKCNAVHRWFVENVQGGRDECQRSHVSAEQLRALVAKVKLAFMTYEAKGNCEEILPTQGGFFFGSTEYDQGYEHELLDTIAQLEPLLAEPGADETDYYYQSSW